jgi:hypothetical protein
MSKVVEEFRRRLAEISGLSYTEWSKQSEDFKKWAKENPSAIGTVRGKTSSLSTYAIRCHRTVKILCRIYKQIKENSIPYSELFEEVKYAKTNLLYPKLFNSILEYLERGHINPYYILDNIIKVVSDLKLIEIPYTEANMETRQSIETEIERISKISGF